MARLIKRYESRKLYDTQDSRYVSLHDLAGMIRAGDEVQVIDNDSSDDVTTQTLTQVILEEGRQGESALSSNFLHELVRKGEEGFKSGVDHLQQGMDRFVHRLGPVREAREEMGRLRERLEQLERSLSDIEQAREA